MIRNIVLLTLVAVVVAFLAALATQETRAAFPGKNGKVFFESD